jgi:hypothetical protein
MVSNTFARSLGYGGSSAIKGKSISEGGGKAETIAKKEVASNGNLGSASVPTGKSKEAKNSAVGSK